VENDAIQPRGAERVHLGAQAPAVEPAVMDQKV